MLIDVRYDYTLHGGRVYESSKAIMYRTSHLEGAEKKECRHIVLSTAYDGLECPEVAIFPFARSWEIDSHNRVLSPTDLGIWQSPAVPHDRDVLEKFGFHLVGRDPTRRGDWRDGRVPALSRDDHG